MTATVLSFLNFKGGVGKTSATALVSYNLAKMGKKCLVIDFDPQANITALFLKTKYQNKDKDDCANLIFWYYRHKEELSDFPEKMGSELNKFQTFYSISVATSIWVFLLELYEMKFSYTVLRGGAPLVYLSQ